MSNSVTLLRLSAVVNEGKGASALTEVTNAKNKIVLSVNIVPPVIQMLDKADRAQCLAKFQQIFQTAKRFPYQNDGFSFM